jgi:hypothetical protein
MDPTKEQRACIKFCANLGKGAMETLTKIGQAFEVENMSRHWCLNSMFSSGQTEKDETGEE